jgi:3-hydroxyacyl-CoA dehydrogenase
MSETVSFDSRGSIGIIRIDNPPVNALSKSVRAGLMDAITQAAADPAIKASVLICVGRTFIAGADMKEFDQPLEDLRTLEFTAAFEASPKPIVAAIHGTALGGGFEVALVCHYRAAVASAKVGLPEVTLGLLPGAGGTQRLPRAIGAKKALEMITTGQPISAVEAHQNGIVDRLVDGDLLDGAIQYAEELVEEGAALRKLSELTVDPAGAGEQVFADARASIAKRARGFFAPERCIQAVEAAVALPFSEGIDKEWALFLECVTSPESAAQRYVFFGERAVAKIPDIAKDTAVREIKSIAVIGAGTMGGGIAMNYANAGIPVVIKEIEADALQRGLDTIEKNYLNTAKKGRLSEQQVKDRLALISGSTDYADVADADLVIEAVFENLAIKQEVFRTLDDVCKPGAILATNTSTLDVDQIAGATKRPEDVIGLHFFSPANVMRLLEIVRGRETSKEVVATAMKMAKAIRKVGVLSGVCYGFIGNRMLEGYLREAGLLLLEGATPSQVDKAMYDFGMPMGPMAMGDLAGLDVGYKVRQARTDLPDDERYALISNRLAEQDRFGQKTGRGFYRYEPGSRVPLADDDVQQLIAEEAARLSIPQRDIGDEEIVARCIYPLINTGARILEEGIALRSVDIDIVWITGYGFPVYRGGPMFYADQLGVAKVYENIVEFGASLGNEFGYWEPAPLLKRLAEEGGRFGDL